jgi:hypothetical protein
MFRLVMTLTILTWVSATNALAQNAYDIDQAVNRCRINPYLPPSDRLICVVPDVINTFAMRWTITQAHMGDKDREIPFVIITNLEDSPQDVVVEYFVGDESYIHTKTLRPRQRLAIGLHTHAMSFPGYAFLPLQTGLVWNASSPIYFSATAYFARSGAMEMAWHRITDGKETFSKAAVLVPRIPSH